MEISFPERSRRYLHFEGQRGATEKEHDFSFGGCFIVNNIYPAACSFRGAKTNAAAPVPMNSVFLSARRHVGERSVLPPGLSSKLHSDLGRAELNSRVTGTSITCQVARRFKLQMKRTASERFLSLELDFEARRCRGFIPRAVRACTR